MIYRLVLSIYSLYTAQFTLHFEKASVLFNLGALLSQLGGIQNRSTADGLKLACQNFQVRNIDTKLLATIIANCYYNNYIREVIRFIIYWYIYLFIISIIVIMIMITITNYNYNCYSLGCCGILPRAEE